MSALANAQGKPTSIASAAENRKSGRLPFRGPASVDKGGGCVARQVDRSRCGGKTDHSVAANTLPIFITHFQIDPSQAVPPTVKAQLTFNGWPAYTFAGDSGPGQANGHGVNGKWFEITSTTPQA